MNSIRLGLESISALLAALGDPQKRMGAVIHVAGTNGKGSVCALIQSALSHTHSNLKIARFSSPHLLHPSDSTTINGTAIAEETRQDFLHQISRTGLKATSFEIETAVAFAWFAAEGVDASVVEVGLGGRLDATNVFPDALCVVTLLGLDHTEFLGDTIDAIAREKAGIVHPESRGCVLGAQSFEKAERVVEEWAQTMNCALFHVNSVVASPDQAGSDPTQFQRVKGALFGQLVHINLPLLGHHQRDNLAIALATLSAFYTVYPKFPKPADPALLIAGIEATKWRGRLEFISIPGLPQTFQKRVLADGAHNAQGAVALRQFIDSFDPTASKNRKILWVFACKQGAKQRTDALVSTLFRKGDSVWVTSFETPEGMPWVTSALGEEVWECVEGVFGSGSVSVRMFDDGVASVVAALKEEKVLEADDGTLVVFCGSLYLMASLHRFLEKK
ncbi:folylpolyglutamate synthase [Chytriomyces hyalinus]|nr:folylpolyglutamate synthase [Chytriomyces hyalinus]